MAISRRLGCTASVLGTALLSACGPRQPAVLAPIPDAEVHARALEHETRLEGPLRIVFGWQLNEAGSRVSGRGVARVEPPYKARLDLFLGNGETVVSAALVDGELRLPAGAPDDVLPPADLMWGALGVFRPEDGTQLVGGDRLEGESLRLRYRYGDGSELHYQATGGSLRSLDLVEDGHVVQRVEVAASDGTGYPVEATYRNLTRFRELKLTRESLQRVGPYPADIWDPIG